MRANQIAIAGVLALLGACAQTEAPAPNKNTNWLQECTTDADCSEALSCICGVCTEHCTNEDACAGRDGMATCRHEQSAELIGQCGEAPRWSSVCVAACEEDADCERVGDGAHCEQGACIASTNAYVESVSVADAVDGGSADAPCIPYGDGCAPLVATGLLFPRSLEVRDERVYWFNYGLYAPEQEGAPATRLGSLESALVSGADRVVLARDLREPTALALDAEHAYFLIRDHEVEPSYTKLVRVPLAGGELEVLLDAPDYYFGAIVFDETDVYCAGINQALEPSADPLVWNLYRIPKGGQSPQTVPDLAFAKATGGVPLEIVKRGGVVYWKNSPAIWALNIAQPGSDRVVVPRQADVGSFNLNLALTRTEIVWFQRKRQVQVSRVDLSDPTKVTTTTTTSPDEPVGDFVADDDHVWWSHPSEGAKDPIVRTDKATGATVTIAESSALHSTSFALSNDFVLVASSNPAGLGFPAGFIARFPKRDGQ